MTWALTPAAEGTEVCITAENVPEAISPEDHQVGLDCSLDNLAAFLEQRGQP